MVVVGWGWEAASSTSRSGTPASNCGDERVAERVRPHGLGDPRAAGYLADDPGGAVPVQPAAIGSQEDGSFAAFADGQVDRPRRARCERDGDDLAALAGDHQGPVPALDAEGLDVRAGGFGDAQPLAGQPDDQRMLTGRADPGGDQHRAQPVPAPPRALP